MILSHFPLFFAIIFFFFKLKQSTHLIPMSCDQLHTVQYIVLRTTTRDKKFEYGLVLDWYGTVHIGIASGLLSLSENRNEVRRYGSSMALKTGQLTTISNDPAAVHSIKGDSSILQKKQSIKGESSILETRPDGIAKSIEGDSSII